MAVRNRNTLLIKFRDRKKNLEITASEDALTIKRRVQDPLVVKLLSKAVLGKETKSLYITLVLSDYAYFKVGNTKLSKVKRIARVPKAKRVEVINTVISILGGSRNVPSATVETKVLNAVGEKLGLDVSEAFKLVVANA